MLSLLKYRRCEARQSSSISFRIDPTNRMTDGLSGKTPTTLVLRLTSLLTRSSKLVEWINRQCSLDLPLYVHDDGASQGYADVDVCLDDEYANGSG